ncbi:hypothetical protein [Streptomyces murinus]|uniref:hypothetical protein n=1 Tax=Streptomyces murinus TaxID=33900 RepID=UPI00382E4A43
MEALWINLKESIMRATRAAKINRQTGQQAQSDRGIKKRATESQKTGPILSSLLLDEYSAAAFTEKGITPGRRAAALREIVWERHWEPISRVCKANKYTICVRVTGEPSIRRIAEGAKPKPHTILEKSIKGSSVKAKYGGRAENVMRWLCDQDLDGFVGHWGALGLMGVRIDNPPKEIEDMGIVQTGENGEQYVPVDTDKEDGGPALVRLKINPRWKQYLYTGDYDLHEVYAALGGGGGQIPEATPEKVKLLNRLNAGIAKIYVEGGEEKVRRSGTIKKEGGTLHMEEGSYAMFQHGDQATYRMNQYLEAAAAQETQVPLVRAVATESDEPLAWCRFGQWYVTNNRSEHAILRNRWNLTPPHTWGDAEVQRTEDKGYRRARFIA